MAHICPTARCDAESRAAAPLLCCQPWRCLDMWRVCVVVLAQRASGLRAWCARSATSDNHTHAEGRDRPLSLFVSLVNRSFSGVLFRLLNARVCARSRLCVCAFLVRDGGVWWLWWWRRGWGWGGVVVRPSMAATRPTAILAAIRRSMSTSVKLVARGHRLVVIGFLSSVG